MWWQDAAKQIKSTPVTASNTLGVLSYLGPTFTTALDLFLSSPMCCQLTRFGFSRVSDFGVSGRRNRTSSGGRREQSSQGEFWGCLGACEHCFSRRASKKHEQFTVTLCGVRFVSILVVVDTAAARS